MVSKQMSITNIISLRKNYWKSVTVRDFIQFGAGKYKTRLPRNFKIRQITAHPGGFLQQEHNKSITHGNMVRMHSGENANPSRNAEIKWN